MCNLFLYINFLRKITLGVFGLDNAGKTTTVKVLAGGKGLYYTLIMIINIHQNYVQLKFWKKKKFKIWLKLLAIIPYTFYSINIFELDNFNFIYFELILCSKVIYPIESYLLYQRVIVFLKLSFLKTFCVNHVFYLINSIFVYMNRSAHRNCPYCWF